MPRGRLIQLGGFLVALCLVTVPLSLLPSVPYGAAALSWFVGALGMGLCFGAIATLTLELSGPEDQGANSAALQVCDSAGSVLLIGAAGAIYAAAVAAGMVSARTFTTIWWVMAAVVVCGALLAARIGRPTLGPASAAPASSAAPGA